MKERKFFWHLERRFENGEIVVVVPPVEKGNSSKSIQSTSTCNLYPSKKKCSCFFHMYVQDKERGNVCMCARVDFIERPISLFSCLRVCPFPTVRLLLSNYNVNVFFSLIGREGWKWGGGPFYHGLKNRLPFKKRGRKRPKTCAAFRKRVYVCTCFLVSGTICVACLEHVLRLVRERPNASFFSLFHMYCVHCKCMITRYHIMHRCTIVVSFFSPPPHINK